MYESCDFPTRTYFFSAMESPSTSDNEGKNSPPSYPALTIVTISKEHPHGLWRIDAKERRRSQSGNVMHRHPIDSPDCQEKDLRSLNGSQNKDKERIQQECKQGDHKEQLACTKLVHANQEAAETEGSEAKHDSRKDEKAPTELSGGLVIGKCETFPTGKLSNWLINPNQHYSDIYPMRKNYVKNMGIGRCPLKSVTRDVLVSMKRLLG